MAEREWLPVEWVDEVSPPSRPMPDDFIVKKGAALFLGYAGDARDVDDDERKLHRRAIAPGDIVRFFWSARLEDVVATINKDGTFVTAAPVPEGANWFWNGDELCGDTLAEFVKEYIECLSDEIEGETVTLSVRCAATGDQPFRLLAGNDDRGPRFESISHAEARQ